MTIDYQALRLDGVYRMNDAGQLMLRIKIPAGVLSAPQAETIGALADEFGRGALHLTCRGSIELHWLDHGRLPAILRRLAAVGLTTRGACGGAVRGIACSTGAGPGFAVVQRVIGRLHRHFAGNPHFEGLPKKFKIGVETGYAGARHLIQDFGIVHTGRGDDGECFDVWCAGGLGREPQAAFLLRQEVAETALLPLAEAAVRVFARHAPPGKRLKHVVRALGPERLGELIAAAEVPLPHGPASIADPLTADTGIRLEIPVFAGELAAAQLRRVAGVAAVHGDGTVVLTADQDLALFLPDSAALDKACAELAAMNILNDSPQHLVTFRICPGSHECRMGLAATRDVARRVIATLGPQAGAATWAISGCPNSCSQPQLADFGIVTVGVSRGNDGSRAPRFDIYRRDGEGLGHAAATGLELDGLLAEVGKLG